MTRRRASLAALYLLLGLVATWAVAWGSALFLDARPAQEWGYEASGPPHRVVSIGRTFAGRSYELKMCVTSETLARVAESENRTNLALLMGYELSPVASDLMVVSDNHLTSRVVEVVARGWPWTAASVRIEVAEEAIDRVLHGDGADHWLAIVPSTRWQGQKGPYQSIGALEVPFASLGGAHRKRSACLLPCVPYWPGLIANTLFYAAAFLALHQLVGFTGRWRRRRRGRCAACGYDLTGIDGGCPECGAAGARK